MYGYLYANADGMVFLGSNFHTYVWVVVRAFDGKKITIRE